MNMHRNIDNWHMFKVETLGFNIFLHVALADLVLWWVLISTVKLEWTVGGLILKDSAL